MKALELLKILNKYYTGKFAIKINEAIKELEDLKSRSCVTCKYGHPYSDKYIECSNSKTETEGLEFKKDFYCKNWELKNE